MSFQPAFWLKSPHIQSLLASSPLRKSVIKSRSAEMLNSTKTLLLNGGDGVQLLAYWTPAKSVDAPLVILIHGWEGSSESGYLLSAANHLFQKGFQIARLILRDHDDSHHLNPELFHSCRHQEVANATSHLIQRVNATKNFLAGFSLGGNFALRVANSLARANIELNATIAICPVTIPAETMNRLESGFWIYQFYFIRKWKRSLSRKIHLFPESFSHLNLSQFKSLRELTEYFVHNHTEFDSSENYFEGYRLTRESLQDLTSPVHILMSQDDPIIDYQHLSPLSELSNISITYTEHGGHCGFLLNRHLESWADHYLLKTLSNEISRSHLPSI